MSVKAAARPGLCFLLIGASSTLLQSQTSSGSLSGVIQDRSGGVVANATLKLVDPAASNSQETTSNSSGLYSFAVVPPATYCLETEAPGFKRCLQPSIEIHDNQRATLDVTLELGAVSESIQFALRLNFW